MKLASVVSAVISSLAPSVFAQDGLQDQGVGIPAEDYHYGMNIDVHRVLQRTDTSRHTGVVPVTMVYLDSQGEVHKVRFLEWGGSTSRTTATATTHIS